MTQKQATNQRWSPPQREFLKINIDGAYHETTHSGGWGFTIRNDDDNLLVAGAGKLEHVSNILNVEALAMLNAATATSRMGYNRVILETDSKVLKLVVSTKDYNLALLGDLFEEIRLQFKM